MFKNDISHERIIFTRQSNHSINIESLSLGEATRGCCVCCNAPSCLPGLSALPCIGETQYIRNKLNASKYVFIRENSIEFNSPEVTYKLSNVCCFDPCDFVVRDNITVIYYDDPLFDSMTDTPDYCSTLHSLLFGSQGGRIKFEHTCCFGLFVKGKQPCPIVPRCCPMWLCPCAERKLFYLADAQKGMYDIRTMRSQSMDYHRREVQKRAISEDNASSTSEFT